MTQTVSDDSADIAGALLLAVAEGDRRAFEQLYRETSARLFGVCYRILNRRSEAEDVLQEVYTTIWRKAGQFDPTRARAMTWLTMMARNRSIDQLRAAGHDRQALPMESVPEPEDEALPVEALAGAAQEAHGLNACLQELQPERRSLIRKAFFDGCTYEELARRDGTPLGTVKSWIRRSLAKLKECLER